MVYQNSMTVLIGTGVFDQKAVNEFIASARLTDLAESYRNLIPTMDRLADILFER